MIRVQLRVVAAFLLAGVAGAKAGTLGDIVYSTPDGLETVSPDGAKGPPCRPLRGMELSSPAWNPTKTALAFEAGPHDATTKLYVVTSACADARPLQRSAGFMRPTWHPTEELIYALSYQLPGAIAVWRSTGERLPDIVLAAGARKKERFQTVDLSPSGRHVALLNYGFDEIIVAAIDGERLTPVAMVPRGFSYVAQARWLTEDELVFVGRRKRELGQLWRLQVETGTTSPVSMPSLALRDYVALSPDRKHALVCAAPKTAKLPSWQLWRYSFGSGNLLKVTRGSEDVGPTWATTDVTK